MMPSDSIRLIVAMTSRIPTLVVPRLHSRVPISLGVARELHLPRLAAHRAVLHVRLAAPSLILEGELGCFAAVGAHYGYVHEKESRVPSPESASHPRDSGPVIRD